MKSTADISGVAIVELPRKTSSSVSKGYSTVRTFKGREENILAKRDELYVLGYETTVMEGPLWTLEASIGTEVNEDGEPDPNEELIVQWEMMANPLEKDILESYETWVRGLPAEYLTKIGDLRKEGNHNGVIQFSNKVYGDAAKTLKYQTDATGLWNLINHGTNTFIYYQPTLRRTVTPYINYNLTGFLDNVGKIHSTSTLINTENIPANFAYVMPDKISPNKDTTDGIELNWGWLKNYPSILQISNARLQVQQDWVYGLWSELMYGAAI